MSNEIHNFDHLFAQNVRTATAPPDKVQVGNESQEIEAALCTWARERACTDVFIKKVLDPSMDLVDMMQSEQMSDHIALVRLTERRLVLLEFKQKFLKWAGSS
jgi:hypothetical protein